MIFGLQQPLPGDPAVALAGEDNDPNVIAYLRGKFHLDEPLPVRYWYWLDGVFHGDLGDSVRIQKPVTALILEKLPVTIELPILAMAIALTIGFSACGGAAVGLGGERGRQGPRRAGGCAAPRASQCAGADRNSRGAPVRRAPRRRGAHRAGLLNPGLRQAHRRRGLQPRLFRCPRGRALYRHRLHHAEPARGHRLLPGESAHAGLTMAAIASPITATVPRELTPWQRALRRLVRRRGAMVGLTLVVFFVALALLAPWLAPYDPLGTSWSAVRKAPSAQHWFGTDEIGRDVLSRVVWGARASLLAGLVSVAISLSVGVPVGLAAGYLGRWTDMLISRVTDAMLACPFLILAIALAAFLGPSLTNAMIAIGIAATPVFIRLTRR